MGQYDKFAVLLIRVLAFAIFLIGAAGLPWQILFETKPQLILCLLYCVFGAGLYSLSKPIGKLLAKGLN